MLTAAQAKEIQPEGPSQAEIKKVEAGIKDAATEGHGSAFFVGLSTPMVETLRQHGYSVLQRLERNETTYTVGWGAPSAALTDAYYNK